jgi:hypothetical protein
MLLTIFAPFPNTKTLFKTLIDLRINRKLLKQHLGIRHVARMCIADLMRMILSRQFTAFAFEKSCEFQIERRLVKVFRHGPPGDVYLR